MNTEPEQSEGVPMRRVYKYKIPMHPRAQLELPVGAKFLRASNQCGKPTLWFEIKLGSSTEIRTFTIYGTGHDITSPHEEWLGTFDDGPFVWHVYEAKI